MFQNLSDNIVSQHEMLALIRTGIIVVYERKSGTYIMLRNCIESYYASFEFRSPRLFAIDEKHPLFVELVKEYQIRFLPAMIVISNDQVSDLVEGPISKIAAIEHLESLVQ